MKFNTFLINLDGSDARLATSAAQLEAVGILFTRVPAFDGRNLKVEEFPDYDSKAALNYIGRPMRGGEIGCYLSHLKAAAQFVETGAPYGLVLEDDMLLPSDAVTILQQIKGWSDHSGQAWHLINLSPSKHKIFTPLTNLTGSSGMRQLTRAHYFPMTTTGLLWSRAGAQAFLTEHRRIFCPVDNYFRYWLTRSDLGLAVWPPLVTTTGAESDISVGKAKRSRGGRTALYELRKQKRLMEDKALAIWHKLASKRHR